MGDYMNQPDQFWNNPNSDMSNMQYYETDYSQFENQNLEFKTMDELNYQQPSQIYNPSAYPNQQDDDFDEPPLLEELEIYPDRILEKILAVSNPFRSHGLTDDSEYLTKDSDLAGPVFFCIVFAICLFLSGNKAHFGYIYGISLISCILMYCLLTLMTPANGVFTLFTVASVLGYCLIPVVLLSVFGVFINIQSFLGILLAGVSVVWSSISASRLFIAISGDREQQPLIAYPCALVYGVYVLLVMF